MSAGAQREEDRGTAIAAVITSVFVALCLCSGLSVVSCVFFPVAVFAVRNDDSEAVCDVAFVIGDTIVPYGRIEPNSESSRGVPAGDYLTTALEYRRCSSPGSPDRYFLSWPVDAFSSDTAIVVRAREAPVMTTE